MFFSGLGYFFVVWVGGFFGGGIFFLWETHSFRLRYFFPTPKKKTSKKDKGERENEREEGTRGGGVGGGRGGL